MQQNEKTAEATPVVEVEGVSKRFGANLALDDVSLELRKGEVLALLGDNGAGKSTLIKCLSGVYRHDEGVIRVNGKEVNVDSPMEARELGIETVYQDLALFDNFNVVGNFFAGREPTKPKWLPKWFANWGWVEDKAMSKESEEIINDLQVNLPEADVEIGLMSGGQRQAVACARAMAFGDQVVILDEPTSALGARESGNVLRLIRDAANQGRSTIIISHNLDHVMQVADRAVVFRRGVKVGEAIPTRENHERLVSMIVGSSEGKVADDGEEPG
ncbi:MAG: sugar ABC transporter ATP-binding protein [Rubrobacter sp.]|jgi:ABC-type sugar transport system ATPase subunit|nr:sugar ABC transporter ATP-binding protein [Rubrobacter sp.]